MIRAMQAIQLAAPGSWRAIETPEPAAPGPGEALVAVRCVGVCGTDIHGWKGTMPFFSYPRIPGHELGVEVLAVGPDCTGVKVGDHCAVEPYLDCGTCFACRRGRGNCCERLQVLGVHIDGGLRPRIVIPARKLHPTPGLSSDQLALVETLAIGWHAIERAEPRAGEDLLVVGSGPIGLSVVAAARLAGARVTVLDVDANRLAFARDAMGAHATVLGGAGGEAPRNKSEQPGRDDNGRESRLGRAATGDDDAVRARLGELTGGTLFPVVVDATGNARAMARSLEWCAFTGRLVYVGITADSVALPDPLLHRRELSVLGSRNALPSTFRAVIDAIASGRLDTRPWISHRAPFADFTAAFDRWVQPGSGVIKAVVDFPAS